MDVRQPEMISAAMDEALKTFGRVDILINNAAGNFLCPATSLSFNAFKTVMEIDTMGTFNTSKVIYDKWFKVKIYISRILLLKYLTPWLFFSHVEISLYEAVLYIQSHSLWLYFFISGSWRLHCQHFRHTGIQRSGSPGACWVSEGCKRLVLILVYVLHNLYKVICLY
uniref:Peroxisomal 2,4-dienoyl-CoA reductase [(3E)-enoyl-CoA-producing] n=1 Tax=Sinocyclocheilus rhinocerous TaxID=307959 RepID=A0A673FUQ1_9TELE